MLKNREVNSMRIQYVIVEEDAVSGNAVPVDILDDLADATHRTHELAGRKCGELRAMSDSVFVWSIFTNVTPCKYAVSIRRDYKHPVVRYVVHRVETKGR